MDTSHIFKELRHKIAGSDQFMSGHQIHTDRGRSGGIKRRVPEWTQSDSEIQKLLIASFPHHQTNQLQRERMARWLAVIYFHFRLRVSVGGVAEVARDRGIKIVDVKGTIKRIRRAGAGLNTAGKQRRLQTSVKEESVKRRLRRDRENKKLIAMDRMLAPEGWLPVRRSTERSVPERLSKHKIYNLIDANFPNWVSDYKEQSKRWHRAKRWYQIIHYFRRKASRKAVARLMGLTDRQVSYTLTRIARSVEGMNTAG